MLQCYFSTSAPVGDSATGNDQLWLLLELQMISSQQQHPSSPTGRGWIQHPLLPNKNPCFRAQHPTTTTWATGCPLEIFVSYFLCVSHMRTRKLNLVLEYNTNHIEPSTPPLHKELLPTWLIHKQLWRCVHPTTISKWASICLRGTPYVFWLDVSWYNTNQGSHIRNCTRLSTNTSNPWTPHQTTWGK